MGKPRLGAATQLTPSGCSGPGCRLLSQPLMALPSALARAPSGPVPSFPHQATRTGQPAPREAVPAGAGPGHLSRPAPHCADCHPGSVLPRARQAAGVVSRVRGAPSPGLSLLSPPVAIQRDPESCEKLEATVLQLRRDQKGLGQAGRGWMVPSKAGVAQQAGLTVPITHRGPAALLCHVEHQLTALPRSPGRAGRAPAA